jgi:hypothetical protein
LLGVEQFEEAGFGAPQNSEVPTQPVSAVASRTALRHSASARSSDTPALRACHGKFGRFHAVAPVVAPNTRVRRGWLPEPFGAMQYMYILLTL